MSLSRSIKRVSSFIKISTDIERLERLMESNPEEISVLVQYMREKLRRGHELSQSLMIKYVRLIVKSNSEMEINNLFIAQEFLKQKYDVSINLSIGHWYLNDSGISDLTWLTNLDAPNLRVLRLEENGIESLKGLSGLYAPNLTSIWLAGNQIKSLEGLSNIKAPNLKVVWLENNPIKITEKERKRYPFRILLTLPRFG